MNAKRTRRVRDFLESFEKAELVGLGVLNSSKLHLNGESVWPLVNLMRDSQVRRIEGGSWFLSASGTFRNPSAKVAMYRVGEHDVTDLPRLGLVFDGQNTTINPYYRTAPVHGGQGLTYTFDESATNLRAIAGHTHFAAINREERNLMALLFHALNLGDNLTRFLTVCGARPPSPGEAAMYLEFAGPRDLWNSLPNDSVRRAAVLKLLEPAKQEWLKSCSVAEFNAHFGGSATSQIQNPGGWNLVRLEHSLNEDEEFRRACIFKWSFNAKPDLVVQIGEDWCLCVEAKLESPIGTYPTKRKEKDVFSRRGLPLVAQTEVQRYAMTELLGFRSEFVLIARSAAPTEHRFVSWGEAFSALELGSIPQYMLETMEAMTSFENSD